VKSLSCVQLFATPWTVGYQPPLPIGFSRQEYWSGVPLPSPFYNMMSYSQYFKRQKEGNSEKLKDLPDITQLVIGKLKISHMNSDSKSSSLSVASTTTKKITLLCSLTYFLVVQLLSHVRILRTQWTAAHQAPHPSLISRILLRFMSISYNLWKHIHVHIYRHV